MEDMAETPARGEPAGSVGAAGDAPHGVTWPLLEHRIHPVPRMVTGFPEGTCVRAVIQLRRSFTEGADTWRSLQAASQDDAVEGGREWG